MKQKVYVVTQAVDQLNLSSGEIIIACRLTYAAAWSIAKKRGGRRVQLFTATKSPLPDEDQQPSFGRLEYTRDED